MNYTFLVIIAILTFFYFFTSGSFTNISRFSPIPGIFGDNSTSNSTNSPINVYPLDSRYKYPYLAPVNPMGTKSVITNSIKPSSDLFYNQNTVESTNELYYSGGSAQLLSIPLQYNNPYEPEILRSQPILITPYNRIKYSVDPVKNDVFL